MLRECNADDCTVEFVQQAAHHVYHSRACGKRERRRQRELDGLRDEGVTVAPARVVEGVTPRPSPGKIEGHGVGSARFERIFIVNDTQFPYIDWPLWDAICFIAEKRDITGLIFAGDMLDFTQLSSFDFNPYDQRRAHEDVRDFNHHVRDPLLAAAKPRWSVWLDGNHENRIVRSLIRRAPEFIHERTVPDFLELPDGMDYVSYGRNVGWWLAEDLFVAHGWAVSKHSAYTAKKHVEDAGLSVLHGHTHRLGTFFQTTPRGTSVGMEMGHMSRSEQVPGFHGGGVANWQSCAGTLVIVDTEAQLWSASSLPVVGGRGDRRVVVPDLDLVLSID